MKAAALLLVGIVVLGICVAVWPRYGFCTGSGRAAEIACEIRRNLHFSAHFTWAVNVRTLAAVSPEVSESDIPALVSLLAHRRPAVRFAAGALLTEFGEAGLAALREAQRSSDVRVALQAADALRSFEIRRSSR